MYTKGPRFGYVACLLLALGADLMFYALPSKEYRDDPLPKAEVFFTPGDDVTGKIRAAIDAAKVSVRMQTYSFTEREISQALVDARWRGVDVRVICDRSVRMARGSEVDFLFFGAVPTWIDSNHDIAHNKVIVIDGRLVLTGSFNYTRSAQTRNAENCLFLTDPDIAASYTRNWEKHVREEKTVPYRPAKSSPNR
jgi:phosphatidylserine/phosphatidylglycerophosphate/cardiolipin synthase-like enzyme